MQKIDNTSKGELAPTVKAIIRTSQTKANNNCTVKIRVTFNRAYKLYNTNVEITEAAFNKIMFAERKSKAETEIFNKIDAFIQRAKDAIKATPIFTFNQFEAIYLKNKTATDTISGAFIEYIDYLNTNNQVGTAIAYSTAKNCFDIHFKGLKFADITPTLLKKFENNMIAANKSLTTISIYVRCLRALFNNKNIALNLQPFYRSDNKQGYKIPSVNNQKKALTVEQIAQIFNYDASQYKHDAHSTKLLQRAKDYFIFMFLSNGMNLNDLCNLTWPQIDGNLLTYQRQKTLGKSNTQNPIQVSLKTEALDVIKKYGTHSIVKNAFVFPHYQQGQTALERKRLVGLLIRSINDYLEIICNDLKIKVKVTTQYARHSFATVLKRANVNTEQISELLGHSSTKTTQHYLASFEAEQIHKTTDILTDILRNAN